jgi:phosphate starvation-inducible PhoH-like protein
MAKKTARNAKQTQLQGTRGYKEPKVYESTYEHYPERPAIKLVAQTQAQKQYINTIIANELIFCTGSAGTGKTYCAATLAAKALSERKVEKIILTRPAVTSGENFGYLPGELSDKYAPYLEPFLDIFYRHFGKSHVDNLVGSGKIVAKPLAFMRGVTFSDSFILLDEAQNCTVEQMKLFLTRLGEGNKIIVDGDIEQKDIKTTSGLYYAIERLAHLESVGVFNFTVDDCVRSKLVKAILKAW